MKCPKCAYLGFDTGERCKHCGYDFSLMASDEPVADLALWIDRDAPPDAWDDTLNRPRNPMAPTTPPAAASATPAPVAAAAALSFEPTLPPPSFRGEPSLPLFATPGRGEDEPLITVPAHPRPPLAVRRTPETPRLRAVAKTIERPAPEPELNFVEEPVLSSAPPAARTAPMPGDQSLAASSPGARVGAALIDHLILLAIDAVVVYLTLRIAALTMLDWSAIPILPMGTFLGLLKLSYFTAFTCVGGQTIGKMAVGIRVVGDDNRAIDAPHAIHRALAGAVSFLTLGAGFLPAVFAPDRRALHDRLAHTRVVVLPTA